MESGQSSRTEFHIFFIGVCQSCGACVFHRSSYSDGKKHHLVCVFVVLWVSRRWQKNPPERSKGTYELKKMILSWISAEGIHPLPAASSDDLESVQLCKSFI